MILLGTVPIRRHHLNPSSGSWHSATAKIMGRGGQTPLEFQLHPLRRRAEFGIILKLKNSYFRRIYGT